MKYFKHIQIWSIVSAITLSSVVSAQIRNPGKPIDMDDSGVTVPGPVQPSPSPSPKPAGGPVYTDGKKAEQTASTNTRLGEKHDIVTQGAVKIQQTAPTIVPLTDRLSVDQQMNANDPVVTVRIAAGSEKQAWMEWAKSEFLKNDPRVNGKKIAIIIESSGSISSGNSIRKGNVDGYAVWSPASSFFRPLVEDAYRSSIFESDMPLVSSPLVFLTYNDVQSAISQSVLDKDGAEKPMSFNTVVEVLDRELAGTLQTKKADWFKFALTNPVKSNSGAMSLVIEAYEYFSRKEPRFRKIEERHLNDPQFQKYMAFQKNYYDLNTTSTGKLGERLVGRLREIDSVVVYENVAIEAIRALKSRGLTPNVSIKYPPLNLVTDHPYYILKHKTTPEQRDAARLFRDFLLEKPQQLEAMRSHGFRPASNEITSQDQDKVFGEYTKFGLEPDVGNVSKIIPGQSGSVIEALLTMFESLKFEE